MKWINKNYIVEWVIGRTILKLNLSSQHTIQQVVVVNVFSRRRAFSKYVHTGGIIINNHPHTERER